ncbi:MAG: hypothetical protein JW751_27205 [Polyangiaceae bacterium]|nr:hypothetical protein [Polyangiaceae bacterium]
MGPSCRVFAGFTVASLLTACGGATRGDGQEVPGMGGSAAAGMGGVSAAAAPSTSGAGGLAGATGCEPIVFDDAVVEAAVREAARVDGGPLFTADVAGITELRMLGASSLRGLECLDGLISLGLHESDVPTLEPVLGSDLQALDIRRSEAPLDEIGRLTSLTLLTLEGPTVSDIGFVTSLTRLKWLTVFRTSVTDITPVATQQRLLGFDATESPIADLAPLAGLPELVRIYVSNTSVTSLASLERPPPTSPDHFCAEIWVVGAPLDPTTMEETIPHLCELGWYVLWAGTAGRSDALWCGPDCCSEPRQ